MGFYKKSAHEFYIILQADSDRIPWAFHTHKCAKDYSWNMINAGNSEEEIFMGEL